MPPFTWTLSSSNTSNNSAFAFIIAWALHDSDSELLQDSTRCTNVFFTITSLLDNLLAALAEAVRSLLTRNSVREIELGVAKPGGVGDRAETIQVSVDSDAVAELPRLQRVLSHKHFTKVPSGVVSSRTVRAIAMPSRIA